MVSKDHPDPCSVPWGMKEVQFNHSLITVQSQKMYHRRLQYCDIEKYEFQKYGKWNKNDTVQLYLLAGLHKIF